MGLSRGRGRFRGPGSEGSGRKVLRMERPYGPRVADCRFAAFITPAEPARSVGETLNPSAAGASPPLHSGIPFSDV